MTTKILMIAAACLLTLIGYAQAQPRPQAVRVRATEVPFRFVSAETTRFRNPMRFGDGAKGTQLEQAFLIKVEVPAARYDALPPDIEPFLYIGAQELRTFAIERAKDGKVIVVTYYSRAAPDVAVLRANAPMVITIEHGRPLREPKYYLGRKDLQTFQAQWLQSPKP